MTTEERIERHQETYNYCLKQAIQAHYEGNYTVEAKWDENAEEQLRRIETLEMILNDKEEKIRRSMF